MVATWCVLVAAGGGTRIGHGPKAFLPLGSRSMMGWAVLGLQEAGVRHIVIVAPASDEGPVWLPDDVAPLTVPDATAVPGDAAPLRDDGCVRAVTGGSTRQDSVRRGLALVPDDAQVVLVHDAARCFTPAPIIRSVVDAVRGGARAVVPGLAITETLRWQDDTPGGAPGRERLVAVQTPQGFAADTLRRAHRAGRSVEVTDDAMLAEQLGERVVIVPGDELAFKVTRPLDLLLAQSLVARGESELISAIHTGSTRDRQALVAAR